MKRLTDLIDRLPVPRVEPLEIREAILAEIEETLPERGADGRRRLVNNIRVTLLSADAGRRKQVRRALAADGGLKQLVASRCAGQDVEVPAVLTLEIADSPEELPEKAPEFRIEGWKEEVVAAEPPAPVIAQLVSLSTGQVIRLGSTVFRIGREKQPKDRTGRPRLENDLYFGEKDLSVSRHHAQIAFDPEADAYRLWDVGSTQGTRIIRRDVEINVLKSTRAHGERLQPGDLIYFGNAGVRFEVVAAAKRSRKAAATSASTA